MPSYKELLGHGVEAKVGNDLDDDSSSEVTIPI